MLAVVLCAVCASSGQFSPAYLKAKAIAVSVGRGLSVRLQVHEDRSIWAHGFMVTAKWQKVEGGVRKVVRLEKVIHGMEFHGWNWFRSNPRTLHLLIQDARTLTHYRVTADYRAVAVGDWFDGSVAACDHRNATVVAPSDSTDIESNPQLGKLPKWFTLYRDTIWVFSRWKEARGAFVPVRAVYERGPEDE